MTRVLCTKWIPAEYLAEYMPQFEFVCPTKEEKAYSSEMLIELLPKATILFSVAGTPVTKEMIDVGVNLKAIASLGVGYDHVDVAYATERKIPVVNSPSMVSEPTAEHTIALIMGIFHNLACYTEQIKTGIWVNEPFGTYQTSLKSHVLGIVGLGRIGKCVARKAVALGMKVIYFDQKFLSSEEEKELSVKGCSLKDVLEHSDCITLHVPANNENYHMFNVEMFGAMKDGAYFVNASRGALVDTKALLVALKNGKLKGAALDVFEREPYGEGELCTMKNVILTPHAASETRDARLAMARECLEGISCLLNDTYASNVVNPSVLHENLSVLHEAAGRDSR